ncbi:MAG: hypothetical protein WBD83_24960 [Xanthobacteraceae bacterium]|jgi:hypothetical protein
MKTFVRALLICAVGQAACCAAEAGVLPAYNFALRVARDLAIRADWQVPQSLPPRFRNHCAYENFTWRPYCADHCGPGYQFYFCSQGSFGCCRPGHGYCDFGGFLRCHP